MIPRLALVLSMLFLSLGAVSAQTSTATLSGNVSDENNAAVAGATVTVLNTQTGVRRTVTTNSNGNFTVPLLQPSTYRVTVEQTNFAPFEANDVALNVNDTRVLNIRLRVGGVAEKVTVEAGAVEVSMSPAVATVVDQNLVERIPLNGRTIQNLVALTPGVLGFTPSSASSVGQISSNGLRTTQNYLTIDGVSANLYVGSSNAGVGQANGNVPGFSQLGTTSNLVSVDALQEFKVQTSNYSPEYGRTPGAQIQLTTKSGSNEYRGTISEYFRNEKLDANDWFANSLGLERAPLRHNNFGGTFSGPLVIPTPNGAQPSFYNGKNRTFFFLAYEGSRIRLPQVLTNGTVPSRTVRNTAAAALRPIFLSFPEPTGPDNSNQTTAPYVTSYSNPQSQDSYSLRLDHNFGERASIFARFSLAPQDNSSLFPQRSTRNEQSGRTSTFTLGFNTSIAANISNEFRFNWSRNISKSRNSFYSVGGSVDPATSLTRPFPLTESSSVTFLFPGANYSITPGNTGLRKQANVTNTLTWVRGNHLYKVGFDYRRSPSRVELPDFNLSANFNTLARIQSGQAASVSYTVNSPRFTDYEWQSFGGFIQDSWKVTRNLTLDYGIRWDVNPAPNVNPERRLVIADFVNPIRLADGDAKLFPTIWNAVAPRVGFAYRLLDNGNMQTVIRGGFGMFYDVAGGSAGSVSGSYFPFVAQRSTTNVQFPFAESVLIPPAVSLTPPYSQGSFLAQYDADWVLPRVYQWNVALEQGLGFGQAISVSYVGNAGRRLPRLATFTAAKYPVASPNFSSSSGFNVVSNAADRADISDYHAMQAQYRKSGRYISALVNYTWSHSIDTNSSQGDPNNALFNRLSPRNDRADSDFDRRHVFSAAATLNLPSTSKTGLSVLYWLTRNWGMDLMFQAQSSYPIDVIYLDTSPLNNLSLSALRPDLVPGQPIWIPADGPLGKKLNVNAFSRPTTLRQGDLPRNSIRVAPIWQPDIALSRTFEMGERVKLRLKGEVFNFVNHPMFARPNNGLGVVLGGTFIPATTFGNFERMLNRSTTSEGIALSSIYAPGGPRSVQLSFRLSF